MKREEKGNLSKDELFEKIKRMCVSKSRNDFYCGLIFLILIIVTFICNGINPFDTADIFGFIFAVAIACMAVWLVLYTYWYKKKMEKIDNPSQLLHCYAKKSRLLIIVCLVVCLVWLGEKFVSLFKTATFDFEHVLLAIVFVASAYLFFQIFKPGSVHIKDMEIIKRLQDLIDKE